MRLAKIAASWKGAGAAAPVPEQSRTRLGSAALAFSLLNGVSALFLGAFPVY